MLSCSSRRAALLGAALLAVSAPTRVTAQTSAAATAPARFALSDTLPLDSRIHTGTLPNGLRWFIRVNHRPEARVTLRLAVAAGSTAEADDQRGLAHFTEHMNFNGSEHFQPEQLVTYLESIGMRFGADANAYTSLDETVYMLEVPSDRDSLLDRGVMALSDFAGRATMTDAQIEKERGVVLEEWRLGQGAEERVNRRQYPVLFHGSRYADRLPIGLPGVIQKAPHDRLRAFYRDWYTPERMAVVAVGDIDPRKMEALIRKHFGSLKRPANAKPSPVFDVPPHDSTLVSIATDPELTYTDVSLMFKGPHLNSVTVGDYRRDLVRDLYTSMLNARFGEIAHRASPPFLSAGAGYGQLARTADVWQLNASAKEGGAEPALAAMLEEVARVARHGFLPSELTRAKDRQRASIERLYAERDKSESRGFARELVSHFLVGESAPGIEAEYAMTTQMLPGITLAEINALTPTLMHEGSRVVLIAAPSKGAPPPSDAAIRAIIEREAKATPPAWVDTLAGKQLMAKLPAPGRVTARKEVPEIGATVLTLSNGVEVWLKPTDFKADEILFSGYALGGQSAADSASYPTAWLAGSTIGDAGVGGYTSTELRKLLSGKIARASISYGNYVQYVSGSARPADLETALQLTYLTFTQPTRDPVSFETLKQRAIELLKQRKNSPEAAFADTITAVNEGNLYLDKDPTVAEVEAVKLDDVLAFHKRRVGNAADFTFAFAGTFTVDSIAPLLARYLGSLPSQGKRTASYGHAFPRFPMGTRTVAVRKGIEPKASNELTFFTTGAPIEELDMHRARAAASILNEHLRQSLRELMGGTYGASVGFDNLSPVPGYATMTVSFGCDPARVDTLVAVTLAQIEELRDKGPSAGDVQKQQEIERRELEVALKQNGMWTGSILASLQSGIDPRRIAHRRERIDLLSRDNLRETYRKYFPLDRRTVITLLPATTITAP